MKYQDLHFEETDDERIEVDWIEIDEFHKKCVTRGNVMVMRITEEGRHLEYCEMSDKDAEELKEDEPNIIIFNRRIN
jgi:hypothetical protein